MNTTERARLLAINLDGNSRSALLRLLREAGVEIVFSELADFTGRASFDHSPFDVMVLNLSHQAHHLIEMIPAILRSSPGSEIVLLARAADEHLWSQALKLGAYDLLPIPAEGDEFLRVIMGAISSVKPTFPAQQSAAALGVA